MDDKIQHGTEDATGKVKEKVGQATDNQDLENEGKASLKKAGDKVKDAASDIKGAFKKD